MSLTASPTRPSGLRPSTRGATSGSAANARSIAAFQRLVPGDRGVTNLPLHYSFGLSVLHSHFFAGASVVVTGASVVDPCFAAALDDHAVTNVAGVPHTFELLDRVGFADMDLSSLRYITQAGGKLEPAAVARYAELAR